MKKPSVISLFTGAGGLDYGFEAAGFRTAVALEMDGRCCATLRHNRKWPLLEGDVKNFSTSEILEAASLGVGEADVLIGGPPCQPFSKSGFWATGETKRLNDPRATTMEAYLRVLAEARPRAFLLENVEGLGFRAKDEGLKLIKNKLALINKKYNTKYSASIAVLNAADFGVPQIRRRMFVIGARDGADFDFPAPTHADPQAGEGEPWLTAWDALHDLDGAGVDSSLMLKGKWAGLLPTVPEGENYLWHTDRGGGEPLFGWRRRFWSFLLKLSKRQPAWTIQAQPGPATGPFHWDNRRLSSLEMLRLQTFPQDIEVLGSISDAQRQLGNAVPSLLAEVLAREISVQLLRRSRKRTGLVLLPTPANGPIPPPKRVRPVPPEYLKLKGVHEAHPGTGKGYGASARTQEVEADA